ncbi:arylamine N-acetyltransferase [Kitasatospora sp. NPDC058397]|uniref:arylamine N-acetyltransferase family protein n=1 Tax=unclassified Kitasatospora TaxID=2633591 RepID=UPI003666F72C
MGDDRATGEWGAELLDVGAYLARTGVPGPLPPEPGTLRRLHRAHLLALPFENLDIPLGRGVPLDLDRVQAKLVAGGRGGYCFEQNLLFAAVLERLGFQVTRLAARALLNAGRPLPRTHLVLLVTVGQARFLADVGFGDKGPLEPLPLTDGALAEPDGWTHRLRRVGSEPDCWVLELLRPDGWLPLYRFETGLPLHQVDCVVMNHYTSTHERSPFTGRAYLSRITPQRRLSLDGRRLVVGRADGTTEAADLTDERYAAVLAEDFGVRLGPGDLRSVLRSLPAIGPS